MKRFKPVTILLFQSPTLLNMSALDFTGTALLLCLLLAAAFWVYIHELQAFQETPPQGVNPEHLCQYYGFSNPARWRDIFACEQLNGMYTRITSFVSRAIPNLRLQAFGIRNSFTTMSEQYAKGFKLMAPRKINQDSDWRHIAVLTKGMVQKRLDVFTGSNATIRLDKLVQIVALKITLIALYPSNILNLNDKAIMTLALGIDELWHLSKDPVAFSLRRELIDEWKSKTQNALNTILPSGSDTGYNAMDYIVPVYGTLWRVALFGVIEVTFRNGQFATEKSQWRSKLKQSVENFGSITEIFTTSVNDNQPTPMHIVKEALRLYTPVPFIQRKCLLKGWVKPLIAAADIEKVHRDPAIFGQNSLKFDPSRWQHIGEKAERNFMPYGHEPFLCPAQPKFGPMIIVILLAAFTTYIDPDQWSLRYRRKESEAELEKIDLEDDGQIFRYPRGKKGKEDRLKEIKADEVLNLDPKAYASWTIHRNP